MWKTRTISAVAIAGVVVSLGVTGCGSDSDGGSESKPTSATTQAAPTPQPGQNPTITSYSEENGITYAVVRQGERDAPVIDLPVPQGWVIDSLDNNPSDVYQAIVYTGPDAGDSPPRILTRYRKLIGNVDPQKIIDLAGGELSNLPGWEPTNPGSVTELQGYKAFQLGGTWVKDGKRQFATQKTVVIPGADVVFVLQFDGKGLEDQMDIIAPATLIIDEQTKITPP